MYFSGHFNRAGIISLSPLPPLPALFFMSGGIFLFGGESLGKSDAKFILTITHFFGYR